METCFYEKKDAKYATRSLISLYPNAVMALKSWAILNRFLDVSISVKHWFWRIVPLMPDVSAAEWVEKALAICHCHLCWIIDWFFASNTNFWKGYLICQFSVPIANSDH